ENRASWSDKLDDALWAFRIAYKTPIGCTPYKLVYGKDCPDCEVFRALSFVLHSQELHILRFILGIPETDTQEKDKNKATNDKTEHRMKKIEKDSHSKPKVESQSPRSTKVNPEKVKVKPSKAEAEKVKKIQFKGPKISNP
nr:reverse transcriptase domain-containing protein [Tanacetum cinerariifolium]